MNDIYVIGGGGIGSWLVPSLCLLTDPKRVTVIDGDLLEEKNLNRQLFESHHLGQNKARALADKYGCKFRPEWFSLGCTSFIDTDWLICCADNHPCRRAVLKTCDMEECQAIIACNETYSSEAFYYHPRWKGTRLDPRVYYPEIETSNADDPRARGAGCTGEAQKQNPQLVSANFSAAAAAQHLYVLWAQEFPSLNVSEDLLPFLVRNNLTRTECQLVLHHKERTEPQ